MRYREARRESSYLPTLPSFRVLFFVVVPFGSLSHFQLPTLSYLSGSPEELACAKSTVSRIWVSTLDFAPLSGRLGNMMGRLRRDKDTSLLEETEQRTLSNSPSLERPRAARQAGLCALGKVVVLASYSRLKSEHRERR